MFCPQCGQQQLSGELRFCSRCGFPLGAVGHILTTGGLLPTPAGESSVLEPSARRRGVRQGAMLILSGIVIVPLLGVLDSFARASTLMDMLPPLAAIICFVGGIVRLLFALIFEQGTPRMLPTVSRSYAPPALPHLGLGAGASSLPPSQNDQVPAWRSRVQTAEHVGPFSVTENTTRLLEHDSLKQDAE